MTHYAPFRANIALWIELHLELREHFGSCEHSYGHWIDLDITHGRFPLWQLLREKPAAAHPQCRDIARGEVGFLAFPVKFRFGFNKSLNQLMTLFGEVTPAPSSEVIDIGQELLQATCPLSGHDPSSNGSSAVPVPLSTKRFSSG